MKLLLDTHVLLWAASEPAELSDDAREALEDGYTVVTRHEVLQAYGVPLLEA